ncbi:tetratricopeptide repeat protein [Sorangium sp. So ce1151]|uniref:tetratricopeptide repeat protein n=1 Tax=Sorangium sp. So ce1151 TaxID=3133332 RepID=UPI003F612796
MDLVESFVQLFEATHGRTRLDAWTWNNRTPDELVPQMVVAAGVLARLSEQTAECFVDRLLEAGATELHLAELLWGFAGRSKVTKELERHARRRAKTTLKHGLAVGHANRLAIAFYHAKLPEIAEHYAKHVINCLKGDPAYEVSSILDPAVNVLFASWVQQKKWTEIDSSELSTSDLGGFALVENLRAVAEIERGKYDEAFARLDRLLDRDPRNPMALTNRAAAYAARDEWTACLSACTRAREALGDATPPEVSACEARAHYRLRDFQRAVAALDRLPSEAARTPEMIWLRVALATATAPNVARIEDDLLELEKSDPVQADFLRARLAPLSDAEIGGGWFASGAVRHFPSFEQRCAARSMEPETVVLRALGSAAQRIAEQPALAVGLSEDQLTKMLCMLLAVLEGVRVYAHPLASGGWGPKQEGLADFVLSEMPEGGLTYGRRIVRGEAKHWKGRSWMLEGMRQIFGTGCTGQELFLALVVYSKARRFESAVLRVKDTLARFGSRPRCAFATVGAPEEVKLTSGRSVRVFKTRHGEMSGEAVAPTRTLYTFVVDILAEPSRSVRQTGVPKRPRGAHSSRRGRTP